MSDCSPSEGDRATTPRALTFPPARRVLRKADFERALQAGQRATDALLTVWIHENGLPHARLGLIVGKRHGSAPQRNRLKRLLREAFRLEQRDLPAGSDLICTPRVAAELDLAGCRQSLRRLAQRLAGRPRSG